LKHIQNNRGREGDRKKSYIWKKDNQDGGIFEEVLPTRMEKKEPNSSKFF